MSTAGEQLLGRELAKEIVAGAQHYVPGQHAARVTGRGEDDELHAELTFVDGMGRAVFCECIRIPGLPWRAIAYVTAQHYVVGGVRAAPEDFLGDVGARYLEDAEEAFKAAA